MNTGTLIDDLFAAVRRAEKSATPRQPQNTASSSNVESENCLQEMPRQVQAEETSEQETGLAENPQLLETANRSEAEQLS
jgi:hypothetical protein